MTHAILHLHFKLFERKNFSFQFARGVLYSFPPSAKPEFLHIAELLDIFLSVLDEQALGVCTYALSGKVVDGCIGIGLIHCSI